jgi:hypothetical protein
MTAVTSTDRTGLDGLTGNPRLARVARVVLATIVGLEVLWILFVFVQQWLTNPAFGSTTAGTSTRPSGCSTPARPTAPWQISGPLRSATARSLYPPTAFLLFIPFIWLPALCGGRSRSPSRSPPWRSIGRPLWVGGDRRA